jgi:cell division protein FtsQ
MGKGATILLVGALVLAGLIGLFAYKNGRLNFRLKVASLSVKHVRVTSEYQHISRDELQAVLEPLVTGGIVDVDLQAVHDALSQMPWVETATVQRIWPDVIAVSVHEKVPYLRWGPNSLVTEQGQVFTPNSIEEFKDWPILSGPEQQQAKVLEIMKGIKTALADKSLALAEFNVNNRWAWRIKLTTGLEVLLGREDQLKKLQRFLKTMNLLKPEQVDAMAVVDLRYPNGYAVSWKPGAEGIDWNGEGTVIGNCEGCAKREEAPQ